MSIYWDHAKDHPDLVDALEFLRPAQDMKLYRLILKAWNKVSVALLRRARNVQTIVEALVYGRTRASTGAVEHAVNNVLSRSLVYPPLYRHFCMRACPIPTNPPTSTPIFTAPPSRIPCEHARCNLYEANKMSRGFIIGRSLLPGVSNLQPRR